MVWLNPNTWPADSGMLSRTNLQIRSDVRLFAVTLELLLVDVNRADSCCKLSRPRRHILGSAAAPDGFVAPCMVRQRQGLQLDVLFGAGCSPLADAGIVMRTVHYPTPKRNAVVQGAVDVQ